MMMITPQACRRITGAVRALPEPSAQDMWRAWAEQAASNEIRTDLPHNIAVIALEALTAAERSIRQRLGSEGLEEDLEADLLNDLGYIQAIETAFRDEGVGR